MSKEISISRHVNINLPGKLSCKVGTVNPISNYNSLEWSLHLGMRIFNYYLKISKPFRSHKNPFEGELHAAVMRFSIALDAYFESSNPVMSLDFILRNALLRNDSASFFKKIRFKSFVRHIEGEFFSNDPDDIPVFDIKDITDIFPYRYLIYFKVEDPCDYKYSLEFVETNPKYLNDFRNALNEMLDNISDIEEVLPEEVQIKTSNSISKQGLKSCPMKISKQSENGISNQLRHAFRTKIDVCPNGERDIIVIAPSDYNRVNLIELQTTKIIEKFSHNLQIKDPYEFMEAIKTLEDYKYFVCRDLTKEGLTKPKILIKTMLEVLHKRYPSFKAYDAPDFFNSINLNVDDTWYRMKRGHGLGMANALTSLMQLIIFRMVLNEENDVAIEGNAYFLNDDLVTALSRRVDLDNYLSTDSIICKELGLDIKDSKSFSSKYGYVFCEEYFCKFNSSINRKEVIKRIEILNTLCCVNVTHAKEYLQGVIGSSNEDYLRLYLPEILTKFGYEFFEDEIDYPPSVGGWFNQRIGSIFLDLQVLNQKDYNGKIYAGFKASQAYLRKPSKHYKGYNEIGSKVFNLNRSQIDQDFHKILQIESLRTYDPARLSKDPNKLARYYEDLYLLRQSLFKKRYKRKMFDSFIKELVNESEVEFYPLPFMIEKKVKLDTFKTKYVDPYSVPNPQTSLVAYIKKLNKLNDQMPNAFAALRNKRAIKDLVSDFIKWECIELYESPRTYQAQDEEFHLSWIDDQALAYVALKDDLSGFAPILKEEYRHKHIKWKRSVFKVHPTIEQVNRCVYLTGSTRLFYKFNQNENINNHDDIDQFLSDLEEVLEEEKLRAPPSDSDSEPEEKPEEILDYYTLTSENFWTWKYDDNFIVSRRVKDAFNCINHILLVYTNDKSFSDHAYHRKMLMEHDPKERLNSDFWKDIVDSWPGIDFISKNFIDKMVRETLESLSHSTAVDDIFDQDVDYGGLWGES